MRALEGENYIQRFAPLYDGGRIRCADVLALCRPELDVLSTGEPEGGWLLYTYDFARSLLFPEKGTVWTHGAGASFLLSVLQVLLAAERDLVPYDPAWDIAFLPESELEGSACAASYGQMARLWRREYVYEMMRLGLEATPYRTLEHHRGRPPRRGDGGTRAEEVRRGGGPCSRLRRGGGARHRQVRLPPRRARAVSALLLHRPLVPPPAHHGHRPRRGRTIPCGIWSRITCPWSRCC